MNSSISYHLSNNNDKTFQKLVWGSTIFKSIDYFEEKIFSNQHTFKKVSIKSIQAFELNALIKGYSNLVQNWDSYNADSISPYAISVALEVLGKLEEENMFSQGISIHVFPMRSGGIQFEFDAENLSAELEINITGEMTFILFNELGDIVETTPLFNYELSELPSLIDQSLFNA